MAQLIRITSEALQSTIRRLLPSQQGFGEDLQASNVITPIIDLTPTAEGSQLPGYVQQALAFGSQTVFDVDGTTSTITSTPGFYRVIGVSTIIPDSGSARRNSISLTDGLSTKAVWRMGIPSSTDAGALTESFDFVVFLRAGDSLTITAAGFSFVTGSIRQLATVTGELVNPVGFSSE